MSQEFYYSLNFVLDSGLQQWLVQENHQAVIHLNIFT